MSRRLAVGARVVVATHNQGKLAEFETLLGSFGITLVSAGELGLPEPVEDGSTFADNARIKATAAAEAAGLLALADDSGLVVHGLEGRPGVHSARWAGPGKDFGLAMRRVHDELVARFGGFESAERGAAFVAALCLAWPDGATIEVEGRVDGEILWPPRGSGGFGYDPMFKPEGEHLSFAEMTPAAKHAISHRGRALEALAARALPIAENGA